MSLISFWSFNYCSMSRNNASIGRPKITVKGKRYDKHLRVLGLIELRHTGLFFFAIFNLSIILHPMQNIIAKWWA